MILFAPPYPKFHPDFQVDILEKRITLPHILVNRKRRLLLDIETGEGKTNLKQGLRLVEPTRLGENVEC